MSINTDKIKETISWLHLSDLHCGSEDHRNHWPLIELKFYDDLELMHKESGPWDLILFTGDLIDKGKQNRFENATEILEKLYDHLKKLQGNVPILLAVPGNHDLKRPKGLKAKAMKDWHNDKDMRDEFWQNDKDEARKLVVKAFKGYTNWIEKWRKNYHLPDYCELTNGLLPGDFL